jgi:hypothetical protein
MSPSLQVHPRLVTLVRWVAHVLSVLILFFFAVMMGGEVMQGQTPNLKPQEILFFAAVAVQLIGLLIAFRKETPGGLMVLVGYLLQAVLLPRSALIPFFAVLPFTGLLRLSCAWFERHQAPPSHAVTGKRASHRIALMVSLVVAVFLGLVSSEIFMSPPPLALRHVAVPAGLVGGWQGQARVANAWVRQRRLPVRLAVDASGMAEGTIGDARFLRGKLLPARSWFGRALRLKTDYVFVGRLEGPVIAAEAIRCDSTATIAFDLAGDHLHGGLGLSCTGTAARNRAPVTIFFKLDRARVATP